MDVVSNFTLAERDGATGRVNLAGGLPKGSARTALDAEIAGEGAKVLDGDRIILSNGEVVAYTPPPAQLVIPDLSNVKSLRHYFGQKGYQVYPAWLYHPKLPPLLVKDAKDAAGRGVVYRETTTDERNRYGLKHVWDWEEGCEWRPNPWHEQKFDPKNPGSGKTVVYSAPDPVNAQHALVQALIPAVAAAVAQSLKATGPGAPATVDPSQWEAFLAFQAWQKAQEVVPAAAAAVAAEVGAAAHDEPEAELSLTNALSPEQDRMLWEEEAKRLGVKVDGRWSDQRLREEVQKAQAA